MITEKDLKTLFTSDEIQNAIKELGVRINSDYGDDELFLICVLKGAVMFTVDLSKHLKMPVHMEFIRLSSYGSGFASTGKVNAVDISLKAKLRGIGGHTAPTRTQMGVIVRAEEHVLDAVIGRCCSEKTAHTPYSPITRLIIS